VAQGQPWQVLPDGILLSIRLTPKAGRDGVDGLVTLSDGRIVLSMRVRAPPSDGEANAALMRLVARTLDIAPSAVALRSGASSRLKMLHVSGDGDAMSARLDGLAAPDS
jgi:uncharacterized protein (TIGR00251 family)